MRCNLVNKSKNGTSVQRTGETIYALLTALYRSPIKTISCVTYLNCKHSSFFNFVKQHLMKITYMNFCNVCDISKVPDFNLFINQLIQITAFNIYNVPKQL